MGFEPPLLMIMPITDLSRLQRGTGPTQHWGVQALASTADCCAAGALMVLTFAAPRLVF